MLNINRSCLRSALFTIVLIFSLFGPQGQASAQTTQVRNTPAEAVSATGNIPLLSGVAYNVGDVFAGVGGGKIMHFSSNGVLLDTLDSGTNCSQDLGMAFDLTNNLYATSSFGPCFGAGKVNKFDDHGNLIGPFGSGYSSSTESIAIDAAGNVYVSQPDGTRQVLKFNSAGTFLSAFSPAIERRGTDWIDLAADQCTLFYTSEGQLVKRFNVCTNMQLSDFSTLPVSGVSNDVAFALRIRPNGEVLVATGEAVFRLNSSGTIVQTYSKPAGETSHLFALNLDPDLTSFWTAGVSSRNIYKIDIASGTLLHSFNAGSLGSVSGLAVFGEITASQPKLILTPATDTKTVGATQTLTAELINCLDPNVTVTFSVTGANMQTGTGTVSCGSSTTFIYTGNNAGTDTVVATATTTVPPVSLTSNSSTIIWNQAPANLSITKSDAPDPVLAGSNLTYTLTVTNNGPGDASGVLVTDTLPAGVTFVSATPSQGSCTEAGGVVNCDLIDLTNGASATVTIVVTVDSASDCGSSLTNRAVAGSEVTDPDSSNNTASTDTTVSCPCTILDNFNRPNGPLGSNWDGRTHGYRIVNNEVAVRAGGPIYWQPETYGPDQEACVTLTRINTKSKQHGLLLKVQELNNWRQGAILVSYNARSGNVEVKARDVSNHKWNLVGSLTPSTPVVDGDQLRAKAFADGTVEVFINDTSIGTADAGSFYVDKGGQIGLWFRGRGGEDDDDDRDDRDNHDRLLLAREKDDDDDGDDSSALRALLDDFGGGTLLAP